MIHIGQPKVTIEGEYAILSNEIDIDGLRKTVWFKVSKCYGEYLCYERSDAYVIAVLNYAMRNGHDIECDTPISEDLYYNVDKYLIDALVAYNIDFHRPLIKADIASETLPCANAVGTGISCGVDSLHALACQTNLKFKRHNITHLTFNNVGSHGVGEKAASLFASRCEQPKKFAEEYNFNIVISDSNLMDVIEQNHYKTHTYSSMFPIFCLQKLYSVYFYASSGYNYHEFRLDDSPSRSCGSYEMLSLPLFSTRNLRIYSEGEGLTRMEKLKEVVKYKPSYKYLNVCLLTEDNCGKCEKCVRTLLGIDALGELDNYKEVFDIEYYRKNKSWYVQQLVNQKSLKKHDYIELASYFRGEITPFMHLRALPYKVLGWFPFLRNGMIHRIIKQWRK
ncbi:MAG: hypothetical protein IKY82_08830 [Alistipes sp.]|nr:hypothetical protein [Alistipes sp.]